MKADRLGYTAILICGCLVAAMALAQTGCSFGDPGFADEERGARSRPSGDASGNPRAKSPQAGRASTGKEELKDPLLRAFGSALDEADEIENSERGEAWKILKEADPILRRAREENRRALERANRPPRILTQRQPAEAKPKPEGKAKPAQATTAEAKK